MSKQCLDVQQMQHLQELGMELKESMMTWQLRTDGKYSLIPTIASKREVITIPAYTLQDVLDALPKRICDKGAFYLGCYDIMIDEHDIYYAKWCGAEIESTYVEMEIKDNLIDAAYNMLCWCIEQGYVETNKNK